jgi:hypothetical protein
MRINRFSEYTFQQESAEFFIKSFDDIIKESDESTIKRILKKVVSDLKLNTSLVLTLGTGIGACYPVVQRLMKNMDIQSFNLSTESIVLLTICSLTIVYLEERKFKSSEEEANLTKDSKSMLEELKMKGIGNGIVKKVIKSLKSIKNIFSLIAKHLGSVIGGVVDMFAYTSLLIPIMNGVSAMVNKYNLTLDTLPHNFLGLSVGVATIITKHGIVEILNKLKDRFPINKRDVISEIEVPVIQKFSTFGDGEKDQQSGDLIKEQ